MNKVVWSNQVLLIKSLDLIFEKYSIFIEIFMFFNFYIFNIVCCVHSSKIIKSYQSNYYFYSTILLINKKKNFNFIYKILTYNSDFNFYLFSIFF